MMLHSTNVTLCALDYIMKWAVHVLATKLPW